MSTSKNKKGTPKLSPKSEALKASILERLKAHDAAVLSGKHISPDPVKRMDRK